MEMVGKAVPAWPGMWVMGPDWDAEVPLPVPQWLSLPHPAPLA